MRLGRMLAALASGESDTHALVALMEIQASRLSARTGPGGGSYAIQARIAACHARAARAEDTDWARIAALYGDLVTLTRSPIVELNRAVAVSMADGPVAGLAVTDGLRTRPNAHTCAPGPATADQGNNLLGRMIGRSLVNQNCTRRS